MLDPVNPTPANPTASDIVELLTWKPYDTVQDYLAKVGLALAWCSIEGLEPHVWEGTQSAMIVLKLKWPKVL